MLDASLHVDTFARDRLPSRESFPSIDRQAIARFGFPHVMNAAAELVDRAVEAGHGRRVAFRTSGEIWSYERLLAQANRIARLLIDAGMVPGNRVLLRAPNNPPMAAAFLGVLKAGGIAVPAMPLLRARELAHVLRKADVQFALCDARLADELRSAGDAGIRPRTFLFNTDAADGLEAEAARFSDAPVAVPCSHDDVALIAFTSGTTGPAKATAHFHRDLLVVADAFAGALLHTTPEDVFAGSAPFAFTFGLGAMLLFPLRFGAGALLIERCTAETLLQQVAAHRVTRLFTVPTLYRAMAPLVAQHDLSALRSCISSGEPLPLPVYEAWQAASGLPLIDSIGSTEMLHAFIVMPPDAIRPGAVGMPLPGYDARVVDGDMRPLADGEIGRLAVRGPVGCRYLDDAARQHKAVRDGWTLTGDAFSRDAEGHYRYHARADDMIISAGYNISGLEVEEALLCDPQVKECAVVGVPDAARGQIVKAFVVLRDGAPADAAMAARLQDLVKANIAPYKYPRAVEFVADLPRTISGKVQRNVLRERGGAPARSMPR